MNSADPSQVNAKRKRDKETEKIRLASLRTVLATQAGRQVLWWFLEFAGVHRSVISGPDMTFYNAGRQDFGHFIEAMIERADQEALFLMTREAKNTKGESNDDGNPDGAGTKNDA